jgi:hypothetical protein
VFFSTAELDDKPETAVAAKAHTMREKMALVALRMNRCFSAHAQPQFFEMPQKETQYADFSQMYCFGILSRSWNTDRVTTSAVSRESRPF